MIRIGLEFCVAMGIPVSFISNENPMAMEMDMM